MQAIALDIPEVVLFTPKVFGDDRGFFYESYNARVFTEVTGLQPTLYKTTIRARLKACCVACTISWHRTPRASWCA